MFYEQGTKFCHIYYKGMSILFIVATHIFQGYNSPLAWWFNVGVQIFLFMSGFFYGAKTIDNFPKWILKRFAKILKPYYIYMIVIIPVFYIYRPKLVTGNKILYHLLNLQGYKGGLAVLGHL